MDDVRMKYQRQLASSSWTDGLPHGCQLKDLFVLGHSFDELLQLFDLDEQKQNLTCQTICHCQDCYTCYCKWSTARDLQLEKRQLEQALSGDPGLLQWLGKSWLRQSEPLPESTATAPVAVNVLGLNIDQEKEIETLKKQLKEYKQYALTAASKEEKKSSKKKTIGTKDGDSDGQQDTT